MAEQDKKRKSRPKSEIVKGGAIDPDKHKHKSKSKTDADVTKRVHSGHHSSRSKPANSEEAEGLKRDIETLKTEHQNNLNELQLKISRLQKENDMLELAAKGKDATSSSSSDNAKEEIASLNSLLQAERNKVNQLEQKIGEYSKLREEVDSLRSDNQKKEKALEAEFDKYKNLQGMVHTLSERLAAQESQKSGQSVASPRGGPQPSTQGGNLPAWRQRELEKQKEAEELRERESRAKIQKVQSLRFTKNDTIISEPVTTGFKDPLLNKPTVHHGGVIEDDKAESVATPVDQTEEEKIAAEMARMNRTLKKGGHNI